LGDRATEGDDLVLLDAGLSNESALLRLRERGLPVQRYDADPETGDTRWHNRRHGVPSDGPGAPLYCTTFSDWLVTDWDWTTSRAVHPEAPPDVGSVANRFDLRRRALCCDHGTDAP